MGLTKEQRIFLQELDKKRAFCYPDGELETMPMSKILKFQEEIRAMRQVAYNEYTKKYYPQFWDKDKGEIIDEYDEDDHRRWDVTEPIYKEWLRFSNSLYKLPDPPEALRIRGEISSSRFNYLKEIDVVKKDIGNYLK